MRKARTEKAKQLRRQGIELFAHKAYEPRPDNLSNTLTSVPKDNYLIELVACAIRGRDHGNDGWEQTLEVGDASANAITTTKKRFNDNGKENLPPRGVTTNRASVATNRTTTPKM